MHPSLVQNNKLIDISTKFDVYSIFVYILQLEYGYDIIEFHGFRSCRDNYNENYCHINFLAKIYTGYWPYNEIVNRIEGFKQFLEKAFDKEIECDEIICVIFRELRMDLDDIDDAFTTFDRLNVIYKNYFGDDQLEII